MEKLVEDWKITLILQREKILMTLFFKRVLRSNDGLAREGKTMAKSFFSVVNVNAFYLTVL